MLTVIVSLNSNESGLQLLGFNPFWYTRSGDGVVFRGQAQHRTVIISVGGGRFRGSNAVSGPCTDWQHDPRTWASSGDVHTHTPLDLANAPVKLAMFFDFKRRA